MKIAIDLMGNDNPPHSILKAAINFLKNNNLYKNIKFIFIGSEGPKIKHPNISFIKAKSLITMEENPILAVRKKKDCSIFIGMQLLKEKKADALISAGNTGALMSCAKMMLNLLPNITRPFLLISMPSKSKMLAVLDVGANISLKSKFLIESAILGTAFQKAKGIKKPKIALLNIGEEAKKGTLEIRKTFEELKKMEKQISFFEFLGNIEGKEVFSKEIDVLITDGFTGNVFLKTSEGIANLILDHISSFKEKHSKLQPFFDDLKNHLHYEKYPGAILIGVDALIIKCHGYSSPEAFISAIKGSLSILNQKIIFKIKKILSTKK
ncbi:MAG: hypothetical protein AMS24_00685 [Chlamydiae bacterium SM23_39]|nr:MAG: hypothetical protein AMS24_00685 [Chlamydiae bacterium SM23_39]